MHTCTLKCRELPDDHDHDDLLESSHEVLGKVQQILVDSNKKLTIEQLLEKAGISEEEYMKSLKISRRDRNIIFRCTLQAN